MTLYRRSKQLGKVVKSVSDFGETHCVDMFHRPDGTFGFELYRRDVETAEGWFPIGFYSGTLFVSQQEAWEAACAVVPWLEPQN